MKRAFTFAALLLAFVAAQSETDGLSEDLVLRLFSTPNFPEGDVTDILVGKLPDTLPVEISLPQGAEVVGTLLYRGDRAQIVLDTQQSPGDVLSLYRTELSDWREASFPGREGGFVESETSQSISFCNDDAGVDLWVGAAQRDTSTDVRLTLSEIGTHSVCNEEERMRFRGDTIPMPTLTTPAQARYSGGGMSSDDTSAIARTVLETPLSPEDLVSAYAEQLPAQGWQLGVRSAEGTQAWHTFSLSDDEGDWQGYLVAITLPEEQVQLFFSVAPDVSNDVD